MPSSSSTSSLVGSNREIDARPIVTLIVFFLVNALVIFPLRIPLPALVTRSCRDLLTSLHLRPPDPADAEPPNRWSFPLGLETAPVLGVLLLLASTCIPGSVVRDGIVGSGGVRPYDIMTLFISFAYISISLDCTGLLRYLAFLVASRSSSSGNLLFLSFYTFFALSGLLIGNDPLILSGTPFLVYFTRHAKVDPPTAYLFTHFQVSNLVSALLVSSNPTNLILTSAFGLSFLQYSAWLALPTLAGAVVLFPILRFVVFRGERMIPRTLSPPKVDPKSALVDPLGGIFGASLFLVTIVCLVSLSAGGLLEGVEGVWTVTAPAALIMLVRDCVHDVIVRKRDEERREKEELVRVKEGREKVDIKALGDFTSDREKGVSERGEPKNETGDTITGPLDDGAQASGNDVTGVGQDRDDGRKADRATLSEEVGGGDDQARDCNDAIKESKLNASMSLSDAGPGTSERGQSAGTSVSPARSPGPPLLHSLSDTFPTPALILTRLPLPLIPFAFSMFILVEALQHTGWIRVFGGWWAAWVFGTNIGATVLLSRVLQQWQSTTEDISLRSLYGAVFALAIGSNFGAYSFVFPASLAGLLWRNILAQKGLAISAKDFMRWNALPVVLTTVVSCLVVAGEVCVMYKD